MKDQIFISYRRDGGEMLSMLLRDRLTAAGYRVFLDVESLRSGKFNTALLQVIEDCQDVLVVLPKDALKRCKNEDDWVRREIAYALTLKKNIIPIMMRGFRFPKELPEEIAELANYNGIEANMSLFPATMDKLMGQFLTAKPESSGGEVSEICIDNELENRFQELFGSDRAQDEEEKPQTPIARLLAERREEQREKDYLRMLKKNEVMEEEESSREEERKEGQAWADTDYHERIDPDSDGTSRMKDVTFTLHDDPGVHTLAYLVRKRYDVSSLTRYFVPELLDYEEEEAEEGTERTFSVCEPDKGGNPVVLIHFYDRREVAVNMGFLDWDRIKISLKPSFMTLKQNFSISEEMLGRGAVDLEQMSPKERAEVLRGEREVWYQADLTGRTIIIDTETVMPVLRQMYYDSEAKKWRTRIKVRTNHSYFSFQIRTKDRGGDDQGESIPLTPLEIGTFYRTGAHGFPQDPVKAAQYLEQEKSAEALYQLAMIFWGESGFQDRRMGRELLEQAARAGSEAAKIELALDCYRQDPEGMGKEECVRLLEQGEGEERLAFLRAYGLECGILGETDSDQALDLYCRSAAHFYMPAMLRLGCWEKGYWYYSDHPDEFEKLTERFYETASQGMADARFAMGCAYLYGQGIAGNKERGLALLKEAAGEGHTAARQELEHWNGSHSSQNL